MLRRTTSFFVKIAARWMPDFEIDLQLANQGESEFFRCFYCHGLGVESSGMAPDLRASASVSSAETFADIVRNGSRLQNGMPGFAHLTDNELNAMRHYIRLQAEGSGN